MEVIREFKKPVSRKLVLDIPERFVKEELEILIIPVNETLDRKRKTINGQEAPPAESNAEDIVYDDLTYLAGTWSDEDAENFLDSVKHFNKIDEELWQ